jgi:hypothetical protein
MRAIFVNFHKFAERRRNEGLYWARERIEAKLVFQASDENSKTEGVEAAFGKLQIIFQWRQYLAMLSRYLRHLIRYG